MQKNLKIAVYGATGTVGSVLVTELARQGYTNVSEQIVISKDADVYFLCLPAEVSLRALKHIPNDALVIDFSDAYRRMSFDDRSLWSYGQIAGLYDKPSDYHLGLTNRISVAGCIATSIELALLPVADIMGDVFITSIIGKSAKSKYDESIGTELRHVFEHPHDYEVTQFLRRKTNNVTGISFVPVIGEHTSGIMTVCQLAPIDGVLNMFNDFYAGTDVTITNGPHNMNDVIGTNSAKISVIQSDKRLAIICSIDNLYRGSATHGISLMREYYHGL